MFDRRKYERIYRTRRECCFNRYHETAGDREADPDPEASIPSIFKGKDVIGRSQTGTGKTLAYLLPVIQRVDTEKNTTQVLIMTPTRELSRQIFDVLRPFAIKLDIDAADIIGGRTIETSCAS